MTVYHTKQVFCDTLHRNYAWFLWLHKQAPPTFRVHVHFGVHPLPEPEPDSFNPEPRVQFKVQENLWTELMVQFGVQAKQAMNQTELNFLHTIMGQLTSAKTQDSTIIHGLADARVEQRDFTL